MIPIKKIIRENPFVKTFWFDHKLDSKPGQFVMLWIPGLDEKPFSISYDNGTEFGLTIFAVGPLSQKLFELNVGDQVGITGPYGNPFSVRDNAHYILVGGGYGAGPLGLLAERLVGKESTVDYCVGARSQDLLLFEERMEKLAHVKIHTATNDGSKGHQGYVTDVIENLIAEQIKQNPQKKIVLATCGPELMEKKVLDLSNKLNIDCEISIERFMKCGFGVCGQCCVDPLGLRMCMEGPVVSREVANKISEFGVYHRDKSGAKIYY